MKKLYITALLLLLKSTSSLMASTYCEYLSVSPTNEITLEFSGEKIIKLSNFDLKKGVKLSNNWKFQREGLNNISWIIEKENWKIISITKMNNIDINTYLLGQIYNDYRISYQRRAHNYYYFQVHIEVNHLNKMDFLGYSSPEEMNTHQKEYLKHEKYKINCIHIKE